MNKLIGLAGFIALFSSCGGNSPDEPSPVEDSVASLENTFLWQVTLDDSTGKMEMNRVSVAGADNSSPTAILASINQVYPEIKPELLRISNDTVYIKIDDAHYLTQQMGSTGSQMYIAGLVYNLTEKAGVQYVNMSFEEGDHAQPGTFTRRSFNGQ